MQQFDSLQAFLSMGGHGPYVWSAYLVSLTVMAWLLLRPVIKRRQLLIALKKQQQREAMFGQTGH